MSAHQVLVDSSVWINYLKNGKPEKLSFLIAENLICTNELILTEILPILEKNNQKEAIEGLKSIERLELRIDWQIIREYQLLNLKNGINRVGIPDLIILQQVIENKLTFYTFDKHFSLINEFINFELISDYD